MSRGCVGILDDFLCVTREVTPGRNELIKERTATMPIPKIADNQREEGPDQWRASSGYSQPCLVVVRCEKERSLCNATGLGQLIVKPKRVGFRILLGWTGKCYTERMLHRENATPRECYTERMLHRENVTPRECYTERMLHRENELPQ